MIADWEQAELGRVREEAMTKTALRRQRLDEELASSNAETEAAQAAADKVIESFERSMDEFFARLTDAPDPVAFASAAMRMPQSPAMAPISEAAATTLRPAEPVPWPDESASAAKSEPETDAEPVVAEPAPDAEAEPVVAETVAEAAAAESAPRPAVAGEASTQVVVTGLTSFGAITSFKQSLERVDGVRRVSLGLGAAGEFIFTAAHPEGFDVSSAIRTFEDSALFQVVEDRLSVTVGANN